MAAVGALGAVAVVVAVAVAVALAAVGVPAEQHCAQSLGLRVLPQRPRVLLQRQSAPRQCRPKAGVAPCTAWACIRSAESSCLQHCHSLA